MMTRTMAVGTTRGLKLVATLMVVFLASAWPGVAAVKVFNPNCTGLDPIPPTNVSCKLQCLNIEWYGEFEFNSYGCVPGSVEIDPWMPAALRSQRLLAYTEPIPFAMLPSTHNSLITHARGYGLQDHVVSELLRDVPFNHDYTALISDQQLSLTDQLRMGVRMVEMDTSYSNFDGEFRTCDARVSNVVVKIINDILGVTTPLEPGCAGHDLPFTDSLDEFRAFFDSTVDDVFIVMLDVPDQDGMSELLATTIESHFGDVMYRPTDYVAENRSQLPSQAELVAMGLRMVFTTGQYFPAPANNTLFYKYGDRWASWTEFSPNSFAAGNCTLDQTVATDTGQILRVVDNSIQIGPFYNSESGSGNVSLAEEHALAVCNLNYASLDQVNPVLLGQAVWAWDYGQPPANASSQDCVVLDPSIARWRALPCQSAPSAYHSACQSTTDRLQWELSTGTSPHFDSNVVCPDGYAFAAPVDGYMNRILLAAAGNVPIWLNLEWSEAAGTFVTPSLAAAMKAW